MAELGFNFPTEMLVKPQPTAGQQAEAKGYTGLVDMEGMQIPVLDGVAHYKGKNFQVGSTGAVMDEKGAIQGFVEDGVVNPPDPVKVRNFMNGQTNKSVAPGTQVAQQLMAPGLQGIKDSLSSLTPNLDSLLSGNLPSTAEDALDTVSKFQGLKGAVASGKNQVKAGLIKKLLGIPV